MAAPEDEDGHQSSHGAASSKSHRPPLLTWVLLAELVILALTFAYLRDEPLPWEDDLRRPPLASVVRDLSAPVRMVRLLGATAKVDLSSFPQTPPWQWDTPSLARAIELHSVTLDNFRDLLEEKEQEWQPRSPLWMIEDFGSHEGWAKVITLKQAEAAYLARRGQEETAFLAAMDLAVLAHLLAPLDAWPSFMLLSLEMHERAAHSLAQLLRQTQLGAETLARLQEEEYKPWVPSPESLRHAMAGFYAFERKFLLGPDGGEPPLPPGYEPVRSGWVFFKPHATLRLFAESFRELQSEPMLTAFASRDSIDQRLQRLQAARAGMLPDSNQAGQEYFSSRIQPYAAMCKRHRQVAAQHAAIMTAFALRRFVVSEGRMPRDVTELTPKYLPTQASDPFSGEPVRHNMARGLIYSVGTDLRDDGGHPTTIPFADPTEPTMETGIGVASPVR